MPPGTIKQDVGICGGGGGGQWRKRLLSQFEGRVCIPRAQVETGHV